MSNECIAFIIFAILLLFLYLCKEKYTSGKYNPVLGQFFSYDYDIPLEGPHYNTIINRLDPLSHNIILYTEENFKGIAVPVRKTTNYILAEQISPYFKTWHFKSMKVQPHTNINLFALFSTSREPELYTTNITLNNALIPNINTFIKTQTNIMTSNFGKRFGSNVPNTRYYLQELSFK